MSWSEEGSVSRKAPIAAITSFATTALSITGMKFLDCSEMKPFLEHRQNKGDKQGLLPWQVWGGQKADPDLEPTFAAHKGTGQT